MERDIKFRGKIAPDDLKELEAENIEIPHNNGWVVGSFIAPNLIVGDVADIDVDYFATEWWARVTPETVGQFTGLKDKNGKEIYKGDILRVTNFDDDPGYITEVRDDRGALIIDVTSSDYDCTAIGWAFDNDMSGYDFEIIGNIHDKAQQKQALINTMRGDEELGLYDN